MPFEWNLSSLMPISTPFLKAQTKLRLTKGEFISVNSKHLQTDFHILSSFQDTYTNNPIKLIVSG